MSDTNANEYFQIVRNEIENLERAGYRDGYLHITSVRNIQKRSTAGQVTQVSTRDAAIHVVEGTARPSTKEEVDAFYEKARLFAAKMAADEERRNPQSGRVLLMPDRTAK